MSDYDDYYPDYDEGFGGGLMYEHTLGEGLTKEEREELEVPDVCFGVDDYDEYVDDNYDSDDYHDEYVDDDYDSFDEGDV